MSKDKELTKGITVTLTIAQIEFIDRNFKNRSEGVRATVDREIMRRAELAKTPAELEAEKREAKALMDEIEYEQARRDLRYDIISTPVFGQRFDDTARNKREGRPSAYTFTEYVAENQKRHPDEDPALIREIAGELWDDYIPGGQPGPAVPP